MFDMRKKIHLFIDWINPNSPHSPSPLQMREGLKILGNLLGSENFDFGGGSISPGRDVVPGRWEIA